MSKLPRRLLITGGLGYIGTALLERIDRDPEDYEVCLFDINIHRHRSEMNFGRGNRYSIRLGNILDVVALRHIMEDFKPHYIYHLAALHFLPHCLENPTETMSINLQGTKNLVSAINRFGRPAARRLVFASSGAVYKDTGKHCYKESDCIEGMEVYGRSKADAEQHIADFSAIPFTIARLFNVYGKRDPVPHLIPTLCGQIASGVTPIKVGSLSTVRDYIHIDDMAEALFQLLREADTKKNRIYNIGTGEPTSGYRLIALLQQQCGRPITTIEDPALIRTSDRHSLVANIDELSTCHNWRPRVSLPDGLHSALFSA